MEQLDLAGGISAEIAAILRWQSAPWPVNSTQRRRNACASKQSCVARVTATPSPLPDA